MNTTCLLLFIGATFLAIGVLFPESSLASPFPATNPFDRIIRILRNKLAHEEDSSSDLLNTGDPSFNERTIESSDEGATLSSDMDVNGIHDGQLPMSYLPATHSTNALGDDMGSARAIKPLGDPKRDNSFIQFTLVNPLVSIFHRQAASQSIQPLPSDSLVRESSVEPFPHHLGDYLDHLDHAVVAAAHDHLASRDSFITDDIYTERDESVLFQIHDHAEEDLLSLADLVYNWDNPAINRGASDFAITSGIIAETLDEIDID